MSRNRRGWNDPPQVTASQPDLQKDVRSFDRAQKTSTQSSAQDTASTVEDINKAEAEIGKDNAEAYWKLLRLSNQGNAKAEALLGTMFDGGYGMPKDYNSARLLYQRAADQGDVTGELNLALMYKDGRGIPKDFALAAKWYRKAANHHDPDASPIAQIILGQIYEEGGYGVQQDYVRAYAWYDIAAGQKSYDGTAGCPISDNSCPSALQRDSLAARMSQEQIDEAQRLARNWKPSSGGAGQPSP